MLKAVRMIIARKCVERKAPLVATDKEVYAVTGKSLEEQLAEAMPLAEQKLIKIGETFNGIYYKMREYDNN